jgi:signal transduction histidine kinase
MHPDDRERTLQARAGLARGIPVRGLENRYLCKDGSYRWLSWQSSVELSDAMVFAVARDITDRLKLDHEQLIMSKLESTGLLAGGLAHDFNNLLGGLLLNLDMVAASGPMTAEQQEHLRRSQQAVEAAKSLTQQLLAFAQGSTSLRRLVDLRKLLPPTVELALRGSAVRGECLLPPDLWPAEIDEGQIAQMVHNLVLNAREATAAGGLVRIEAANVVLDEASAAPELPPGDYLRLRVIDSGAGIATDIAAKIFDPYFSTKQRGSQKGMGLGLTICRTVIQKHDGTIAVDSHPGRGTTVTCHLPAKRLSAA